MQNLQLRDATGKIQQVVFSRSAHKDASDRRERLAKITKFKQGLTEEQLSMLKDRQFVVVDQTKIYGVQTKEKPDSGRWGVDHIESNRRKELRAL